jgi:hypothetical protein
VHKRKMAVFRPSIFRKIRVSFLFMLDRPHGRCIISSQEYHSPAEGTALQTISASDIRCLEQTFHSYRKRG